MYGLHFEVVQLRCRRGSNVDDRGQLNGDCSVYGSVIVAGTLHRAKFDHKALVYVVTSLSHQALQQANNMTNDH